MKKAFLLFLLMGFNVTLVLSQEKKSTTPESNWTTKGKVSFMFNQSAFTNWVARGENTLAGNASINYNFDYAKKSYTWKNNITTSYGLTKSKNTEFEKKNRRQARI